MTLVTLIVYDKLEVKPVNSRRNKNGCLINTIINILIVYVVIDNVEDITGLNTTLVTTVLCIHCILFIDKYCSSNAESRTKMTYLYYN